ncbi:hypothetical protein CTAYLR_007054 [Chrysophaeum taylorii]|uniref:Uncharacterized protein n=1 Tax=Chrysophaeum taylorii TaxID=2483200 RepID=A0AAD7ULG8_9STRA|nr:hypothetical protein CTAYLR_003472 [Chrysophaeum taylorii]KAJ8611015.1 hypothetical protein CTAYLR_007054 [Chrysophaeum taylorii]
MVLTPRKEQDLTSLVTGAYTFTVKNSTEVPIEFFARLEPKDSIFGSAKQKNIRETIPVGKTLDVSLDGEALCAVAVFVEENWKVCVSQTVDASRHEGLEMTEADLEQELAPQEHHAILTTLGLPLPVVIPTSATKPSEEEEETGCMCCRKKKISKETTTSTTTSSSAPPPKSVV